MDFDWSVICDSAFQKQLHISRTADRDDAIQDACLKLLEKDICITRELLGTAILNCYRDRVKGEIRRKARERPRAISDVPEDCDRSDTDRWSRSLQMPPVDNSDATDCSPSTRLERRERRAKIKRAIQAARLSQDHRCALWAWSRGHLAEFVRRRGIAPATARTWVKRAIDALRPHLEHEGLGSY
jgi:DNA-directed RNA polymerase specialized sigma24 family protein